MFIPELINNRFNWTCRNIQCRLWQSSWQSSRGQWLDTPCHRSERGHELRVRSFNFGVRCQMDMLASVLWRTAANWPCPWWNTSVCNCLVRTCTWLGSLVSRMNDLSRNRLDSIVPLLWIWWEAGWDYVNGCKWIGKKNRGGGIYRIQKKGRTKVRWEDWVRRREVGRLGRGKYGERGTAVDMELLKERTDNSISDPHHVRHGTWRRKKTWTLLHWSVHVAVSLTQGLSSVERALRFSSLSLNIPISAKMLFAKGACDSVLWTDCTVGQQYEHGKSLTKRNIAK